MAFGVERRQHNRGTPKDLFPMRYLATLLVPAAVAQLAVCFTGLAQAADPAKPTGEHVRLAGRGEPLVLARDGRTDYVVAEADQATEPERFAVRELIHFLSRVTGAALPAVPESAQSTGSRRIYVGWTKYARRQGIDPAGLGEEEWIIRTVGRDLVLTGGRPRGTLYAVYEFLERSVGCHWLDRETEIEAWGKITPRLGIGDDYWMLFGYYESFPLPWTMVQCLGPDLKHFYDGLFYLFWTLWDTADKTTSGYCPRTYVHCSQSPLDFHDKPVLAEYTVHAPEIIQDETGQWFTSSADHPHRGISIAPLIWE
jgi:hypothetical protein